MLATKNQSFSSATAAVSSTEVPYPPPIRRHRLLSRSPYQANYLPWTEAAGIVVSIYNQTDEPYPEVMGTYAPSGTSTAMGVQYEKTTRKGAPYGSCRTSPTANFAHFVGKYSIESCYRSCLQEQIISKCGCYDPIYSYLGGSAHSSCFGDGFDNSTWAATSDNFDCIDQLFDGTDTSFNMINDCTDCVPPCVTETFAVTVSTAQWPSSDYTPVECTAYNQSGQPWLVGNETANETECLTWYKTNTLLVEIYYERMNYQLLNEIAAYTIANLISDIGGQLGLFLGMSLISVLEFIALSFLLCYYCFTAKSRAREMKEYQKSIDEEKRKTEAAMRSINKKKRRSDGSKPRRKGMSNAVYNPKNLHDAYNMPHKY